MECKGCKGLGSLNIVNVDSIIPDLIKQFTTVELNQLALSRITGYLNN